jgi:2-polyprenyl-3-methyl-5-hydroxy-6-metoxy-1,4-benzoquinol methylase
MHKFQNCKICNSARITVLNTYKHYAIVCSDCNCVTHEKKSKYFLEYIIPRYIAKKFLPAKAFLRLFSDKGEFKADEFYDSDAFETTDTTSWRSSEVKQVKDQLDLAGINIYGKRILDISGGPGAVGFFLQQEGANVTVTEFSNSTVKMMQDTYAIDAITFDYTRDDISQKFGDKFDIVMLRSSIIFCPNLSELVSQIANMLNPNGIVFLESILPSYGEIFWWQQLEYKFPIIYSQETIEKNFYRHGFKLKLGYRDHGSYLGVKYRSYNSVNRHIFTWLIEFPMILIYLFLNIYKRASIDNSMDHKMITQFWTKDDSDLYPYKNFKQGNKNQSKTFGYNYNGYLSGDSIMNKR